MNIIITTSTLIILLMHCIDDNDTLRSIGIAAWVIIVYFLG